MTKTSPVPKKKKEKIEMDFYEALKKVSEGSKLTRTDWDDVNTYLFLDKETLCIHKSGVLHPLIVSTGDIQATDWYVIT